MTYVRSYKMEEVDSIILSTLRDIGWLGGGGGGGGGGEIVTCINTSILWNRAMNDRFCIFAQSCVM